MSQNLSIRFYPEPLRTLAFGSISGTYAGMGAPFSNPVRIFWLQNQTDALLTFSFDGVTDHFVLPSQAFVLLDVTTNSSLPAGALYFAQGQRLYVKGSPGSGSVYLTVFYGSVPS
jgi:hypothetical protein